MLRTIPHAGTGMGMGMSTGLGVGVSMGMGMDIAKGIDMGMKCTKSSPNIVGWRHYLGYNKVNGPKMEIIIFSFAPTYL